MAPSEISNFEFRISNFKRGFTLLEILIAVALMAMAFTIVISTFTATLGAWKRGSEALDKLHHGDFVMDQLVSALRSTAFFGSKPTKYGFWLEDQGNESSPHDKISWVTASGAFMSPDSPYAQSIHRLSVTIEDNDDGDPSFMAQAYPPLLDEVDENNLEKWFISSRVIGLNCRTYNFTEEDWEDKWEDTNTIPRLVEITLVLQADEKYGEPVEIKRIIEIPLAPAVKGAVKPPATSADGQPNAPAANNAAQPGSIARPVQPMPSPGPSPSRMGIGK